MIIALVTDNKNRILQGKTMYDSLKTSYILKQLKLKYNVKHYTYDTIQNANFDNIDILIYTSSQVYWKKTYIENIMYFVNQKTTIIPSIECLLSHENKAFEYMYLKNINNFTLDFKLYSNISSFKKEEIEYPVVIKSPNGSSSREVRICNSRSSALRFIKKLRTKQMLSELAITPFPLWLHHIKETKYNANFIVQKYVANIKGDYRIQVMGNKYFVYYRKLKKGKKYTSGRGSVNIYDVDVPYQLLDVAKYFFNQLSSPHIIFDFVLTDNVYLLEFSAIHTSNVALDNCKYYYQNISGTWRKNEISPHSIREDYYIEAYDYIIQNKIL